MPKKKTPDDAHLDRLVRAMSHAQLLGYREALTLDRDAGADAAFCNRRIAAIDAEVKRREAGGLDAS